MRQYETIENDYLGACCAKVTGVQYRPLHHVGSSSFSHNGKAMESQQSELAQGPDGWVQAGTWVFLSRGFANQRSQCKGGSFLTCGLSCLIALKTAKRLLILDIKDSCQNAWCWHLWELIDTKWYKKNTLNLKTTPYRSCTGAHPFDPMFERNVAHARPDEAEKALETTSASINAGTGDKS